MSAHLLVFPESLPLTYQDWQLSIDKFGLGVKLQESGLTNSNIKSPLVVKFQDREDTVSCWQEKVETLSKSLLDVLMPTVSNRHICLDFDYGATGLIAALSLTAGLMKDYGALCYVDFRSYGFVSLEEVVADLERSIAE